MKQFYCFIRIVSVNRGHPSFKSQLEIIFTKAVIILSGLKNNI